MFFFGCASHGAQGLVYLYPIGAWISGGVEWNIPHHHRANTFIPVQYKLEENADGSKTIWVGKLELRQRMRWAVGHTFFHRRYAGADDYGKEAGTPVNSKTNLKDFSKPKGKEVLYLIVNLLYHTLYEIRFPIQYGKIRIRV
jgi:hypothetical protein